MTVTIHTDVEQGSEQWAALRCGILTASEMKLIVGVFGGGLTSHYRASGTRPDKLTAKREQALDAIGNRVGSVSDLCFLADVSDGVLRGLIKDGAVEKVVIEQPRRFFAPNDDKERAHLSEMVAQRITGFVEPRYITDDMLRGREDEITARDLYSAHYAPAREVGFITNDRWGFTIGYSPDGAVGDEGLIEGKSRRQRLQVETIVGGVVPSEFVIQCQTGLLVSEREWIDFISYSGGLHMATIRMFPDPEMQAVIIEAATAFEAKAAKMIADYGDRLASDMRLIPTERTIELEMVS